MKFYRKIWAIYSMTVFFLMWIVLMPLYLIAFFTFPRSWTRQIIWFSHHIYTRVFFGLTLIVAKVKGRKQLSRKKSYIIISNHRSSVDFMLNAMAFPGVYKFLAKKELSKVPIFGIIVKKLCVLVDRNDPESRRKSINYLKNTLKEGYSVFLYPEGTRNKTDKLLGNFHKGAFRIAIETGTPIAIQTLTKMENISGKSNLDLCPGTIEIIWSKPIETKDMQMSDLSKLVKDIRREMERLLSK